MEKVEQSQSAETPRKSKKGKRATPENLHPKIQCLNWLLVFVNGDNVPLYLQRSLLGVLSEVRNEVGD